MLPCFTSRDMTEVSYKSPKKSQEKVLSKANAQNKFHDSRNREFLVLNERGTWKKLVRLADVS